MAIEKIPENWYIGGPTYPSSFTKDRLTLIQTVNYLTAKIQECIETINSVDPTQVNEFIALVNQLNEAVTQLTSEVNTATETANNASQTATSAKQTADGLAGEIAQANTTANEAKSTADSASATAQGASSKADNAVTAAGEANGKSNNAIQVANAATGSANEAKVAAQAAQNSATSALSNASTALSTANQALTKSETAISSAETANDTADAAKATAEGIASTAQSAVNTANEAKSTADAASAKVDSFVPGHTIVNSSGGSLPTRNKLQFKGAVVSDNSGGDSTIVEIQSGVINSETVVSFEEGQFITQRDGKAYGVNSPAPTITIANLTAKNNFTLKARTRIARYGNIYICNIDIVTPPSLEHAGWYDILTTDLPPCVSVSARLPYGRKSADFAESRDVQFHGNSLGIYLEATDTNISIFGNITSYSV